MEAGKSPTEVTRGRHVPMSPLSVISEFASPSSPCWSPNYAWRLVVQYPPRALASWCLRCAAPVHLVNMLTDQQQYSRHADTAAVCCSAIVPCDCEVVWHSLSPRIRALICHPHSLPSEHASEPAGQSFVSLLSIPLSVIGLCGKL